MPVTLGNVNGLTPIMEILGHGHWAGWGYPVERVGGSSGGFGGLSTLHMPGSTVEPGDTGAGGGAEERTAGAGAGAG